MEGIYPHCAYEGLEKDSGKINLTNLIAVGTGLLTLATGATLLKIGCKKYIPRISNYINQLKEK